MDGLTGHTPFSSLEVKLLSQGSNHSIGLSGLAHPQLESPYKEKSSGPTTDNKDSFITQEILRI